MNLSTLCLPVALAAVSAFAQHAAKVEMKDIKPAVKFEQPAKGFLTPINDKLKLRATEIEFAPGGGVGDHFHVGPGIRYVMSGEVTITDDAGKEQVARQGEYFYESGDKSLKATNKGSGPAKLLVVELIPGDWSGSAMLPMDRRNDLEKEGQKLKKAICGK